MNNECKPIIRKERVIYIKKINDKTLIRTVYRNNREGFYLNELGMKIYEMCNGTNTLNDILDQLKTTYKNVSEENILNDIEKIMQFLEDEGLIDWINGQGIFCDNRMYKYDNSIIFRNRLYYEVDQINDFIKEDKYFYVSPYQDRELFYKQFYIETLLIKSRNYLFSIEKENEIRGFVICQHNEKDQSITIICQKFCENISYDELKKFYTFIGCRLNGKDKMSFIFLYIVKNEIKFIEYNGWEYKGKLSKELKDKEELFCYALTFNCDLQN